MRLPVNDERNRIRAKALLIAALTATVLMTTASAHPSYQSARGDATPGTCDRQSVVDHRHRARALLRQAYDLDRWAKGPKRSLIRAAQEHKRCVSVPSVKYQLRALRVKLASRLDQYAAYRKVTPYDCGSHGYFATPCSIVERESNYNPRAENTQSSAGGYYQFLDTTWFAYGGTDNGCYHVAACASELEQHQVASRAWDGGAGASHWSLTYP